MVHVALPRKIRGIHKKHAALVLHLEGASETIQLWQHSFPRLHPLSHYMIS